MTELGIRSLFAGNRKTGANGFSRRACFKLRQGGDRARDRRDWQQARAYYSRYLALVPEDAAIWVQYGHACKELGDLDAAAAAYRKATEVAPTDADARFWLDQTVRMKREASEALSRVPASTGTENEATPHGTDMLPKRVLIDLSDVLFYLHHHHTVSGIQRVQLGLAEALLRMLQQLPYRLAFVCGRDDGSGWLEIDNAHLKTLINRMAAVTVDHERLKDLIGQIEADAAPYEPAAGDLFLILGAFWVSEYLMGRIPILQKMGAIVGVLIHDLIPVTHAEFFTKGDTGVHQLCLDYMLRVIDFILTNSDYSKQAVHQYLQAGGIPAVPLAILKLAHQTGPTLARNVSAQSSAVKELLKKDYVLYVSTIEARKNHLYLYHIWKRLKQEIGDNVPTLVLVGRKGWLVNDLTEQLKNTGFLGGKIKIIHGLSDPELSELYRNCLFTVFPSFVEGWGLPIGESLMFGRPCLASNTSSMPEVAGEFADYLDPYNVQDGYEKIKRFIADVEYREARAAYIRSNFQPRQWHDVANDLLQITTMLANEVRTPRSPPEPPLLQPGTVYPIGHGGDLSEFVRSGRAFLVWVMCDTNWHGFEDWGRWMRGRTASLHFRLSEDRPRDIVLMIVLRTVEEYQGSIRIMVGDGLCHDIMPKAGEIERLVVRTTPKSRTVRIDFETTDSITVGDDPRPLSLGLCAIAYAPMDDLAARVNLLEALTAKVCDLRPLAAADTAVRYLPPNR